MPLSKDRDRERKRLERQIVQPNMSVVQPKPLPDYLAHPNGYLLAHIRCYPEGFNPDGTYRKDYDPELDPYINPLVCARVQPKQ